MARPKIDNPSPATIRKRRQRERESQQTDPQRSQFIHDLYKMKESGCYYSTKDGNKYHRAFFRVLVELGCVSPKIGSIQRPPEHPDDGCYFISLRPSRSVVAFMATFFRSGVETPFFLGQPILREHKADYIANQRFHLDARRAQIVLVDPELDDWLMAKVAASIKRGRTSRLKGSHVNGQAGI